MAAKFISVSRSAISGIFFLAYGLAALPYALLLMLPIWPPSVVRMVIRWFYKIFVFFATLFKMIKVETDPATELVLRQSAGKIIVMNHVSLIDICVLMAKLRDSTAIAKASTKRNPFLAMVVKRMFIANDEAPELVISEVQQALNKRENLIVFPEGTRIDPKAPMHELHRGAARLALATRAPIAIFKITYNPLILAKHQPWWDMGTKQVKIRLEYRGELIPQGENTHHTAVVITEQIKAKIFGD